MTPRHTIAELLKQEQGALVMPGVGSALEATAATAAGFSSIYVSGYATAGWQAGKPDIGLVDLGQLVATVAAIRAVTDLPILVDADTGYGDVSNVVDTVNRLERAGASGIQLEDQTWPKRCGHLAGKTVEPADVMVRKITAALAYRVCTGTFIVARTDARGPLGLDEAIRRIRLYSDAGADAVFVDAPQGNDELITIGKSVQTRLVVNMSESGLTPIVPTEILASWGFDIVLYPTGAMRVAAAAIRSYYAHLLTHQDTTEFPASIMALDTFNDLVGMGRYRAIDAALN